MRIAARLSGVLLLTVCLAACDTEEVLQLASQNASIRFQATGVETHYFDIWEGYEDNDNDNLPDAGTTPFLWCVAPNRDAFGNFPTTSVLSAPWRHSLRVSILRAGETTFTPISDDLYLDPTTSVTPFDSRVFGVMTAPPPNTIVAAGRTFKFRSYRNERLTALNPAVVSANQATNPLHLLNPSLYRYGDGLCSTAPASVVALAQNPLLAGGPPPYSFELGKGETVRVEAAKSTVALQGLVLTDPALGASLFIDGVNANDYIVGVRGTGTGPGEVLSFTYTSR